MSLQLKVEGKPPIEVTTNIPVTLYANDKIVAIANGDNVQLCNEKQTQRKVSQAWSSWHNGYVEVETVWDGTQDKSLTKSKLKNQKGLLMGDYASSSATGMIMDKMFLASKPEKE
jgi:hypothetical protein